MPGMRFAIMLAELYIPTRSVSEAVESLADASGWYGRSTQRLVEVDLLQVNIIRHAARANGAAQAGFVRILQVRGQRKPGLARRLGRVGRLATPLGCLGWIAADHRDLHGPRVYAFNRV